MTDRLRTATKLNLRPNARLALEALAIDLGCSMVQAAERLLALPHQQLVALCKADQPAATEAATWDGICSTCDGAGCPVCRAETAPQGAPQPHQWVILAQEYDDTFFRCERPGCGAKTNCRRGYPDPLQGGPCLGTSASEVVNSG